ncbi:MAG: CoF synthetase [Candidatus Wallbacteria bacterium]|nr:CoF synthetase [Candidatus Wallbacteria bacterium]
MPTRHFLFGRFHETDGPLDAEGARSALAEATSARRRAAATGLGEILDVLAATGKSWSHPGYPPRREALGRLPEILSFSQPMIERTLELLPLLLEREALLARIRAELGSEELLDGWVRQEALGLSYTLRPRGVLLHVSAGNVFLGAVDSLVMGLVTKNVNLMKLSRADPYFPLAFVRSLAEHDPRGVVTGSIGILSWKGGDTAVEAVLKQGVDTIMVWGGEEAVRSYRSGLGLGTHLVEYGPKLSGAILTWRGLAGAGARAAARGLARDLAMWDQSACSSPQTVYVQDGAGPGSGAARFLPLLLEALQRVSRQLPPGRMTVDEKVEVRKSRELARFEEAQGESALYESPRGLAWTVIHERRPGFVLSPLGRTLFVKSVSDLEGAIADFEAVGPYLQCVAVQASPEELGPLTLRLAGAGGSRFCAPGSMPDVLAGSPHDGRHPLAELVRKVGLELDSPRMEVPGRLARLLAHASRRSPFHARRLKGLDPRDPDALSRVPLMTKDDVYAHTPPLGGDLLAGPACGAVVFASGGSTGQPKFSYYTSAEFDRVAAVLARLMRAAGLAPGDRVANLFVAGGLWSSFVAVHQALAKLDCLNLPIGGHIGMDAICEHLSALSADVLIGLPSMILELAHHVRARRIRGIRARLVLYGGEHVSGEMRAYLARALGVEAVRSAGYASVDAGTIGFQCERAEGSVHHLVEGHQLLELLDPDTGRPVPLGEAGEVVVTSLERLLMPMIRYRTGDLARRVSGVCRCGASEERFELLGRCDDRLQIGGARIVVSDVARALGTVPGLTPLFQLEAATVRGRERLTLRVESAPGARYGPARDRAVRAALMAASEDLRLSVEKGWLKEPDVQVVPSGGIPRVTRTQKVRTVVDKRRR